VPKLAQEKMKTQAIPSKVRWETNLRHALDRLTFGSYENPGYGRWKMNWKYDTLYVQTGCSKGFSRAINITMSSNLYLI